MKRIHLFAVVALTMITLIFASAQTRKTIQVTSQTIAKQPRSKPYVMDLTGKGKTYTVSADVASRVRIRTSKGDMAMTDLMSKLGVTSRRFLTGSKFLVGTQSDLSAANYGRPPATRTSSTARANLTCGPDLCECDPDIQGDCDGRGIVCAELPMVCWVCDGPACPPERRGRWTCACVHI